LGTLSQSFSSPNALGAGNSSLAVNPGYTLSDGNGGNNYAVTLATASGTITPAAVTVAFNADQPVFNPATGSVKEASLFWDQFRGVIGRNSGKLVVLRSDLSFGFEGAIQSTGDTLTGPGSVNSGGQTVSYSVTNLSNGRAASASREQGSSGIAERLNLVVDSSEQETLSPEQVQALLGQAMKSIQQGGAP
jgi:hypothetical protein